MVPKVLYLVEYDPDDFARDLSAAIRLVNSYQILGSILFRINYCEYQETISQHNLVKKIVAIYGEKSEQLF